MWHEINSENDLIQFISDMSYFHDSCIKEMSYLSGAYVSENLSMFPLNNSRVLRVLMQRQYEKDSMIEMEFQGLKFLKLFPVDEKYTCEILDSTMLWKDSFIYWCDCGGLSKADVDDYTGTSICASKLRWRSIRNCMGSREFYRTNL